MRILDLLQSNGMHTILLFTYPHIYTYISLTILFIICNSHSFFVHRWLGEKYDGVRCFYDPPTEVAYPSLSSFFANSLLLAALHLLSYFSILLDLHTYSRHGREINILTAMKHEMPKLTMDCELWYGRGQYSLSSAMITKNIFSSWDFLRYCFYLSL